MRKYVPYRPRAQWCEDDCEIYLHEQTTVTVFEHERSPIPTGVLDKNGNEFMAVDARNPCGFVDFEGWVD